VLAEVGAGEDMCIDMDIDITDEVDGCGVSKMSTGRESSPSTTSFASVVEVVDSVA
jgi:hypothetical protein